MTRANTS